MFWTYATWSREQLKTCRWQPGVDFLILYYRDNFGFALVTVLLFFSFFSIFFLVATFKENLTFWSCKCNCFPPPLTEISWTSSLTFWIIGSPGAGNIRFITLYFSEMFIVMFFNILTHCLQLFLFFFFFSLSFFFFFFLGFVTPHC